MLFPKPIGNTLPLNLFFPTHSVLFPSALLLYLDGTVYPAEYASMYRLPGDFNVVYCLRMQIMLK